MQVYTSEVVQGAADSILEPLTQHLVPLVALVFQLACQTLAMPSALHTLAWPAPASARALPPQPGAVTLQVAQLTYLDATLGVPPPPPPPPAATAGTPATSPQPIAESNACLGFPHWPHPSQASHRTTTSAWLLTPASSSAA